jgi:uncharacterized protein (TIGR02147 family)
MPSVIEYTDYRLFLKDYYEEVKQRTVSFSYQRFSELAGVASKGYLYNVIKGSRRLSSNAVAGLVRTMKLSRTDGLYFETLVDFNHARTAQQRTYYFERLSSIKVGGAQPAAQQAQTLRQEQYDYFGTWYHSAIRSLIDLREFRGDYAQLASWLSPRISVAQAKKSVALLMQLGIVRQGGDGRFEVVEKVIHAAPQVKSLALRHYHNQMGALALKALDEVDREERHFIGMTVGISQPCYDALCEELEALRNKIADMVQADQTADRTFQINIQLFPLSNQLSQGGTL